MVTRTGSHRRRSLHEEHGTLEWAGNGRADLQCHLCFDRLVHVAGAGVVLDDLRFYLRGGLEPECTRVCDCSDGKTFARRADEKDRRAIALSRSRKAAAGTRDALVVLRFFAIPDYLVRQSSGRDWLVHPAHAWRLGRRYRHDRDIAFRGAVFIPAVAGT